MEELAAIDARGRGRRRRPRAGTAFCLDTAHLWGAGYAIDTAAGVDATLAAFDARVGLDRLRMVHLNDSRSELGSRADRHEHVGAGRIGGAGLARMVTHPALGARRRTSSRRPGMEEGYDAVNIARVQDLAAGRPLADAAAATRSTPAARRAAAPRPRTTSR